MSAQEVIRDLQELADPEKAAHSAGYFKTGPGDYGEGDIFIGLTVPQGREIAVRHKSVPPAEALELLQSPIPEVRLCALHILVNRYKRSKSEVEKAELFALYLFDNSLGINDLQTGIQYCIESHLFMALIHGELLCFQQVAR